MSIIATEGSTEHSALVFGVETALWQVAAKKTGKWYRGFHEAAERFMARWHENGTTLSRKREASVQGDEEGRGNIRKATAVDESRKGMADRVEGSKVPGREPACATRVASCCGCFEWT